MSFLSLRLEHLGVKENSLISLDNYLNFGSFDRIVLILIGLKELLVFQVGVSSSFHWSTP